MIDNQSATVRRAKVTDAAAIARVHVASWRTTYPGMVPDQYLVALSPLNHAARWRGMLAAETAGHASYVVVEGDQGVVGFGTCGPQRTRLEGFGGEFYAIYLYDFAQNRGYGRALMASMAADLARAGHRSACVWVLRDNPSRWFYERLGAVRLAEQPITFAGSRLSEVAYGWTDLAALARQAAEPPASGV